MKTEPNTPLEAFLYWEANAPQRVFLKQPVEGIWKTWTYQQAGNEVRRMASALVARAYPLHSNIAILSKNCAHWVMADLAIWMAGHVSVPLYPTLSPGTIGEILRHSESRLVFVGKLDNFAQQRPGLPDNIARISFTLFGEKEGDQWDDLVTASPPLQNFAKRDPEEIATIKYTSGTTGNPKGVMITFGAMHFATTNALRGFDLGTADNRFFSYLPLSHIAERMLVQMGAIYSGATIFFSESLEKFPENLMEAQPTVFLGVPRIWAKFREKIEQRMPNLDKLLRIPLVSGLLKKILRKKLGLSRAKWAITGAAPISKELLDWFQKIGITVHEAYGMTENLAFSHINLREVKFGSVGQAWPDVSVKLTEEGEIQTRSKAMMSGYFKEPALTESVFTRDGFLKTGDKGEVDDHGFLTITGRIKDQFKTDKAKFVDPAPIELLLMMNPDIEQVCVVGTGLPQPIALAVLSPAAKAKAREQVQEGIRQTLDQVNPSLQSYERIQRAVILHQEWSIENGLITPTLKVKRNAIEERYAKKYRQWFERDGIVVWDNA